MDCQHLEGYSGGLALRQELSFLNPDCFSGYCFRQLQTTCSINMYRWISSLATVARNETTRAAAQAQGYEWLASDL